MKIILAAAEPRQMKSILVAERAARDGEATKHGNARTTQASRSTPSGLTCAPTESTPSETSQARACRQPSPEIITCNAGS
jgi:hypothetical protein